MCFVLEILHHKSVEQLAITIYAPYKPFVGRYQAYEDNSLSNALDNIRLVNFLHITYFAIFLYLYEMSSVIQT